MKQLLLLYCRCATTLLLTLTRHLPRNVSVTSIARGGYCKECNPRRDGQLKSCYGEVSGCQRLFPSVTSLFFITSMFFTLKPHLLSFCLQEPQLECGRASAVSGGGCCYVQGINVIILILIFNFYISLFVIPNIALCCV